MSRSILQNLKGVGARLNGPISKSFLTPHDVNHHLHIPTAGRVQHYRAEALPFVPVEIKTQIRFPKAYAMSSPSLRYLDQVRMEIDNFTKTQVKHNLFTGEAGIPLTATLQEVEVLYGASQSVKDLAETGELKALHSKVADLRASSDSQYQTIRDKLLNAIKVSQDEQAEVDKQAAVAYEKSEEHSVDLAEQCGRVKAEAEAAQSLIDLQNHWINNVENDDDSRETLGQFINHLSRSEKKLHELHSQVDEKHEDQDHVLSAQVAEISEGIAEAASTFEQFNQANAERTEVFSNFSSDNNIEHQQKFKNDLLKYLATVIVVKESRVRYQKEQFDRLIVSSQMGFLKNQNQSLDRFAENYTGLIEALIDVANGGKSQKIQANYDDMGDQTIRPLNSAVFYYFFSASKARRGLAQWMLASARYPNQKVRRAYMKFFS